MNTAALDVSILGPALLAGMLVTATHVPLGQQVLARGIIFIDLAIAQVAGLGLIAAHVFGWEIGGWRMQLTAFVSAFAAALILAWTERYWAPIQEALIGTMFVLAATGAILLLSASPQGGEYLRDLMVGQILWASYDQLWPVAVLYAALLALWFGFRCYERTLAFYMIFALAITASVQLVGVFLVFSSLIIPALFTRNTRTRPLASGYGLCVLGYVSGIVLSALWDLPTGAVIVWSLAVFGLVTAGSFSAVSRSG